MGWCVYMYLGEYLYNLPDWIFNLVKRWMEIYGIIKCSGCRKKLWCILIHIYVVHWKYLNWSFYLVASGWHERRDPSSMSSRHWHHSRGIAFGGKGENMVQTGCGCCVKREPHTVEYSLPLFFFIINIWFVIRRLNKYILYTEGLSKGTQATQSFK